MARIFSRIFCKKILPFGRIFREIIEELKEMFFPSVPFISLVAVQSVFSIVPILDQVTMTEDIFPLEVIIWQLF